MHPALEIGTLQAGYISERLPDTGFIKNNLQGMPPGIHSGKVVLNFRGNDRKREIMTVM